MSGLPPSAQTVLAEIERAAEEGRCCPSNRELADAMGSFAARSASEALMLLEMRGYLMVDRSQAVRIVTIVATGKATAQPSASTPAARYAAPFTRIERSLVQKPGRAAKEALREPARGAPCLRCGARLDAGCGHTASRLIGTQPGRPLFA